MAGETDLGLMLRDLEIRRREGVYVYVHLAPGVTLPDAPLSALVTEVEGTTVVMRETDADVAGLDWSFRAAWLTLTVHSSLDAVGLTAAVSTALAVQDIPCNIIAGYHHDHLLVPEEHADAAMDILDNLAHRPEVIGG